MNITSEILDALETVVDEAGGCFPYAKKIGVAHSTVQRWLQGPTGDMNDIIFWERVYPTIKSLLEKSDGFRGIAQKYNTVSNSLKNLSIPGLTPDQQMVIRLYRQLTEDQQANTISYMNDLVLNNRMNQFKKAGIAEERAEYGPEKKSAKKPKNT